MWEPRLKVSDSQANVVVWNTPTGPAVRLEVFAPGLTVPAVMREVVAHIERELSDERDLDLTDTDDELNADAPAHNVVLHLHRLPNGRGYGRSTGPLDAPVEYPRTNLRTLMEAALSCLHPG